MAPVTKEMVGALDTLGSALLSESVDERMALALADVADIVNNSSPADAEGVQDVIDSINSTLTDSDMHARNDAPLAIERQRATLLDFAAAMDQERTDAGVVCALAASLACRPLSPAPSPTL